MQKISNRKLNVAVIGAGTWGKNHIRVLRELENINLKIISDLNEEQLKQLKHVFNVNITTNYNEILDDNDVDAVSICTPASTHYKIASEALLADKHVLLEKPIALTSEQALKLVQLAKRKNKILIPGHIFRFNPALNKLKEIIKNSDFGKLRFMYSSRIGLMTPRPDCGVIFDFALHDIDISCFIVDDYPCEVTAKAGYYLHSTNEDVGFITLNFNNNIMANIVVSWLTPIKLRDFWMVGEKKSAKIDFMTQQLDIYDKGITPSYDSFGAFKLITREGGENRPFIQNREPLKEEITHFIDCIINDKKPIVGGQEACSIIKIIEACYKSIKEEKTVKINLK